jgi:tRNA(fMet)-specific endonuclease VapC
MIRAKKLNALKSFINPDDSILYLCVVCDAELRSLSKMNKWGKNRNYLMSNILDTLDIIDVNNSLVDIYAEIDSYSQGKNADFDDYPFGSARNMGKNDLWIASLATLLNLKLVTTDADFDHLHKVFFEVRKIKPEEFDPFF